MWLGSGIVLVSWITSIDCCLNKTKLCLNTILNVGVNFKNYFIISLWFWQKRDKNLNDRIKRFSAAWVRCNNCYLILLELYRDRLRFPVLLPLQYTIRIQHFIIHVFNNDIDTKAWPVPKTQPNKNGILLPICSWYIRMCSTHVLNDAKIKLSCLWFL